MKKILTFLLAMLMVLSVSACGGNNQSQVGNATQKITPTWEKSLIESQFVVLVEYPSDSNDVILFNDIVGYNNHLNDDYMISFKPIDVLKGTLSNTEKINVFCTKKQKNAFVNNAVDGRAILILDKFEITPPIYEYFAVDEVIQENLTDKCESVFDSKTYEKAVDSGLNKDATVFDYIKFVIDNEFLPDTSNHFTLPPAQ